MPLILRVFAQVLARSILLEPEEGPDKYLYMAQLYEGRRALEYYEKGLELLLRKLGERAEGAKEGEAVLKQRVCMAYCSVAELFLTDLCFEPDAEAQCQVLFCKSEYFVYAYCHTSSYCHTSKYYTCTLPNALSCKNALSVAERNPMTACTSMCSTGCHREALAQNVSPTRYGLKSLSQQCQVVLMSIL